MRVNKSAIGSLHMHLASSTLASPACLLHARNFRLQGQLSKTDPAEPELPVHRPRPAAHLTPGVAPDLELWLGRRLDSPALSRHRSTLRLLTFPFRPGGTACPVASAADGCRCRCGPWSGW